MSDEGTSGLAERFARVQPPNAFFVFAVSLGDDGREELGTRFRFLTREQAINTAPTIAGAVLGAVVVEAWEPSPGEATDDTIYNVIHTLGAVPDALLAPFCATPG